LSCCDFPLRADDSTRNPPTSSQHKTNVCFTESKPLVGEIYRLNFFCQHVNKKKSNGGKKFSSRERSKQGPAQK
jgi:hypothetical protein